MTSFIWALIGFTALFALIQIGYYLLVYSRFAFDKGGAPVAPVHEPVSVIVYAKNDLKNLKENLRSILAQVYPEFEVLVINDGSWDGTGEYLEDLARTEPRLKLVDIKLEEKYQKNKKFALTLGIKASSYEWLLFTDADCAPVTHTWISEMSRGMTSDKDIVLGYSRFKRKNSFLNLFVRWENFYTAMQYFSYSLIRKTYMGNGRNMAYRKSLFFNVKGFASHQHIQVGEDDLFVNETATPANVAIVYSREAFVENRTRITWKLWWKLKRKSFFTAKFYKPQHKTLLSTFDMSHVFFYAFLVLSLVLGGTYRIYPILLYLLRLMVQGFILFRAMDKLRISKIFGLYWLFDMLMIPYYLSVGFVGLLTKKMKA